MRSSTRSRLSIAAGRRRVCASLRQPYVSRPGDRLRKTDHRQFRALQEQVGQRTRRRLPAGPSKTLRTNHETSKERADEIDKLSDWFELSLFRGFVIDVSCFHEHHARHL